MADTKPGEVAEADFGRLGLIWDAETGRRRLAWGMLVVLGYSRHSFLWPLFGQKLSDVIEGLESCWAFFGGIPRYLVLDNFPRAVVRTDPLNPRLTLRSNAVCPMSESDCLKVESSTIYRTCAARQEAGAWK
jgi:transposase